MPFNPAVGFELWRSAAERGDAEAQGYLGFRLAMGIYPPLPGRCSSPTLLSTHAQHYQEIATRVHPVSAVLGLLSSQGDHES